MPALMPHSMADDEEISDNVGNNPEDRQEPAQSLGHHTNLAISPSLTRHLDRSTHEKRLQDSLVEEVRRLRIIEKEYELLRASKASFPDRVHPEMQRQGTPDKPLDTAGSASIIPDNAAPPGSPFSSGFDSSHPDDDPPPENEGLYKMRTETPVPQLKSLLLRDFKRSSVHWKPLKIRKRFAIDILVGEPVASFQEGAWQFVNDSAIKRPAWALVTPSLQNKAMTPGQAPLPERIRINSKAVADFLEHVLDDTDSLQPQECVMIRPYKALVCFEKELQMKFSELFSCFIEATTDHRYSSDPDEVMDTETVENGLDTTSNEQHAASAQAPVEPVSGQTTSTESDEEQRRKRILCNQYREIKCLMDFVGQIKQKIAYIESPHCQTISFADVWYMFKPGDEIVRQSSPQVYRIFKVAGQTHKIIERESLPTRLSDFERGGSIKLLCAYISFDGEKLGPVTKTIYIHQWDGERPVVSLPAFPLRYIVDRPPGGTDADVENAFQASRNRFIARGKTYLNVSTAAFKHVYHSAGLTLEKDEVDGHVVVDFSEAFANGNLLASQARPPELQNMALFIEQDAIVTSSGFRNERIDELCVCDRCEVDFILYDEFAEQKRSREYVAGTMSGGSAEQLPLAIYPRSARSLRSSAAAVSDDDLLIMDFKAPGFVLRSRKWGESKIPCSTHPLDIISVH